MSIEIHVPDIGADEVEVTEILVKVGDKVAADQSLLSVEGDKASMEVPASDAGVVKSINVKVGDKVKTGSLIMTFEGEAAAPAPAAEAPAAPAPAAPAASAAPALQEVKVPDIGGDAVEVTEIMVKVGDSVSEEQSLLSVEGDKASMEVPAPFAGTVKEIKISVGDKVSTGSLIMVFETAGSAPAPAAAPASAAPAAPVTEKPAGAAPAAAPAPVAPVAEKPAASEGFVENSAYAHASPVIRRLAREFGINLAKVSGSGRKGRVVKEDVQNYVKQLVKQVESGAVSSGSGAGSSMGFDLIAWPKVDFAKFGEVEAKPLSRIQKLSGANLHRNWVRIPHVTQFDEADITGLEEFRKEQNALADKKKMGVKYTPLVFIMKAVAKALEEFPTFNSSLSDDGASLILKKYVHLGIAVDTPNGLV
ncbi:MAG TPA: biotin/lipoyl-containing protein, partial [Rheinheimera sp.]|nr:biotin/lipoyl-containing protein [Rheinheimera sp.]